MLIKQLNRRQTRWSEFFSRFNYRISYRFDKIENKSNILTRRSNDLFKKRDTSNSRYLYQHQTILKSHVLNLRIIETRCRTIVLNSVQLYLVLIVSMKIVKVINFFYAHVWKHYDLSKFFVFDKDTQFIFDV